MFGGKLESARRLGQLAIYLLELLVGAGQLSCRGRLLEEGGNKKRFFFYRFVLSLIIKDRYVAYSI